MTVRSWLRSLTILQRVLLGLVVLVGVSAIVRPLTGSPYGYGSAVNFAVVLLAFFLSRLRLWRVRNRLLVSYFLFGVVPLILVAGLVTVTLTTLFGLLAADRIRRELDDRAAAAKAVARQVAAVSTVQPDLAVATVATIVTGLDTRARAIIKVGDTQRPIPDDGGLFQAMPSWTSPDFSGMFEADHRYFIGAHAHADRGAEAEDAAGEQFGDERLTNLLREHKMKPLDEIVPIVTNGARAWAHEPDNADDTTILLARRI